MSRLKDRLEETERQERCARGDAWRLAKNIFKLKERDKAAIFSPTNEWSLPAPSTIKSEERGIVVVDSGASMHMVSRKDLNSAYLQTVKSLLQSDDGCCSQRRSGYKRRCNSVCQRIGFVRDSNASRRYTSSSLTRKTLRRSRVYSPLDQWSKTTTHQKWQKDRMQHGELRIIRSPWSIDKLFKLIFTYISDIFIASYTARSGSMSDGVRGDSSRGPAETENPNKNDNEIVQGDPLRDLPEWLEEFKENLVDDSVPEHRDAPSSVNYLQSRKQKWYRGKHSIFSHFPRDRNCDICLRTKITRALCRKRVGTVVPRAETFGDLITADHTFFREGCESRHNHRYAVVVQDLAYPRKTNTLQETEKSLQKFSEPTRKPKVIYTDISQEFGKSCEDLS